MSPHVEQLGPNALLIYADDGIYLQAYNRIIACRCESGVIVLDKTYWDYSKTTTGKWRNYFLSETKKETQKKINSGVYKLKDLNTR